MTSQTSSLGHCNLVFYVKGQFPQSWDASPEGKESEDIQSLVLDLLKSPLFGTGSYLGPRYYKEGSLKQVDFHTEVCHDRGMP